MADELTISAEDQAFFGDAAADMTVDPTPAPADPKPADPTPAPDLVDPEGEADAAGKGDRKTVPLAALHEERQRRQELQQQLTSETEKRAKLEERVETLAKKFAPAEETPPAPATVTTDPIAVIERNDAELKELKDWKAKQEQDAVQQGHEQQFRQSVHQDEVAFKEKAPDYDDALKFMIEHRGKELELMGIADPAKRVQMINQEARAIAANALLAGKSPAERAYEIAKTRGYAPKGAAAATSEADEKIDQIARGQSAARSLGASPGSAKEKLSLDSIAALDDDAFAKATEGDNWRKMWGG